LKSIKNGNHGGKRPGAGRKVNSLTTKTRTIAEKAATQGDTPLEVMLSNMRHFQKVAMDAEATLEGLTVSEFTGKITAETPEEQFKALLAQVKKTAGFRQLAQECARDAAAYIHPKLTAVQDLWCQDRYESARLFGAFAGISARSTNTWSARPARALLRLRIDAGARTRLFWRHMPARTSAGGVLLALPA
jgi:hypothetical protein